MVLIQSGETQPSLADVARLAGVSERSIFRHFESREALLAAVIERQVEVVTGLLHEIAPTGPLAGPHRRLRERAGPALRGDHPDAPRRAPPRGRSRTW